MSIVYLLFTNLGKRKEGEISAYSMFNDNNEEIAGTFGAKFYENMLLHKKQFRVCFLMFNWGDIFGIIFD